MSDSDKPPVPHPDLPRRVPPNDALVRLRRFSDARIALGRAGAGMPTTATLAFSLDHARARDAVYSALDVDPLRAALADLGHVPAVVHSAAATRETYLTRPDLGRCLNADADTALAALPRPCGLVIVVADGLSAHAANINALPVMTALIPLVSPRFQVATALLVNGRVAAGDHIARALGARAVVMLIGERPGLSASDSLGGYVTWAPDAQTADAQRFCVSNIRLGGLAPDVAARQIDTLLMRSATLGHSGVAPKPRLAGDTGSGGM